MEFRPVMRATKCHVHISVLQRWKLIRVTALGEFTLLYRLHGNVVIYDLPLTNERRCKDSALDAVFLLTLEPWKIRHICYFLLYSMSSLSIGIQGGSNITGTDLCVNKPHCAAAVRP